MGKVADPLREFADAISERDRYGVTMPNPLSSHSGAPIGPTKETEALYDLADQIDREHERRMEQCRHETKRAFAKYLRQITEEYERSHKRKSWLAQQEMQLELDVLKYKEARDEDH